MRLDQCLCDPCGRSKIPIDLEGWMIIEQIGKGRSGQLLLHALTHRLPVAEPGEEVEQPRSTPTGMPTSVRQTELDRTTRRVDL